MPIDCCHYQLGNFPKLCERSIWVSTVVTFIAIKNHISVISNSWLPMLLPSQHFPPRCCMSLPALGLFSPTPRLESDKKTAESGAWNRWSSMKSHHHIATKISYITQPMALRMPFRPRCVPKTIPILATGESMGKQTRKTLICCTCSYLWSEGQMALG